MVQKDSPAALVEHPFQMIICALFFSYEYNEWHNQLNL